MPARQIRRAYILLKSDSNEGGPKWKYQAICEAYDVSQLTVYNVLKKYIEGGLEGAFLRKKQDQVYERRTPDEQTLSREAQAWVNARNTKVVKVDWRFSTADARIKLKRLYPKIHD